jgi:ubiquinone/menaquinone biosynthesis C-methylase UbiE
MVMLNNNMETGKEVYKYDKIYNHEGYLTKKGVTKTWEEADDNFKKKWESYGHAVEGRQYIWYVAGLNPESIIDIGCGWNEFCQIMKEKARVKGPVVGVDCSCPGADIIASAHDIPVQDKSYDLLVSFDCMEHIPKEEVLDSFKEFARICNRMVVKISCKGVGTRIDGERVHTCVELPEWWLDQVKTYFKNIEYELRSPGEFVAPPSFERKAYGSIVIYGESK